MDLADVLKFFRSQKYKLNQQKLGLHFVSSIKIEPTKNSGKPIFKKYWT